MLALPVETLEQIIANLTDAALFDSCTKEKNLWFLMVRYEAYKRWAYYAAEVGKVHWEIQEVERQNREGQLTWFAYSERHDALWDKKMSWTSDQINIMKQMLKKGMISDPDELTFIEHSITEWNWGTPDIWGLDWEWTTSNMMEPDWL
jgi:hypothetical protein